MSLRKKYFPEDVRIARRVVKKWKGVLAGEFDEMGDNCPYCTGGCFACPVYHKTGWGHCHGTPYWDWVKHQRDHHYRKDRFKIEVGCCECIVLVKNILDFATTLQKKVEERCPGVVK